MYFNLQVRSTKFYALPWHPYHIFQQEPLLDSLLHPTKIWALLFRYRIIIPRQGPKAVKNLHPHPRQKKFCNSLRVKNFNLSKPLRVENLQHFQFFLQIKGNFGFKVIFAL